MLQNNSNQKVFISNDFIDSQYYWLLPIVISYCKNLNYNQIVFENYNSAIKDTNFIKLLNKNKIKYSIINKKKIF